MQQEVGSARTSLALLQLLRAAAAANVVAYLPEWRYEGANWDTICAHCTHLLFFSLEPAPDGRITAFDRLPRSELLALAKAAARRHGTRLLLCFGGNGRSAGFSPMVRSKRSRRRFIREVGRLLKELGLDGVDYNWEYPGYSFGSGYMPEPEIEADYKGLSKLLRESKQHLKGQQVTMAYYPDSRQEQLIARYGLDKHADLMHMMSYDKGGAQHSSMAYGRKCAEQGLGVLPAAKLTLGLPFYGRHSRTGDWTSYEDLVQKRWPLPGDSADGIGFNGVDTIEAKTKLALEKGLGGVMIWEVGQDCRLEPVVHGEKTHVRTCPEDNASLLLAISRAVGAAGHTRVRMEGWPAEQAEL